MNCHACCAALYRNRSDHDPAQSIEPICVECGAFNPQGERFAFTVSGVMTGERFGTVGMDLESALAWGLSYGGDLSANSIDRATLAALNVGESWRSHGPAIGIRITRI